MKILRGGAFKPRTNPYTFQGLREEGLKILRAAADRHGLATVTEVLDRATLELVAEYTDMLQVGARNMYNTELSEGDRPAREAGAPEARVHGDPRGVAALRGVHRVRRESRGGPLRARHPHVRALDPQHARHLGDPAPQAGDLASGDRGREPRAGPEGHPAAVRARGAGGRRGRAHDRNALRRPTRRSRTASSSSISTNLRT